VGSTLSSAGLSRDSEIESQPEPGVKSPDEAKPNEETVAVQPGMMETASVNIASQERDSAANSPSPVRSSLAIESPDSIDLVDAGSLSRGETVSEIQLAKPAQDEAVALRSQSDSAAGALRASRPSVPNATGQPPRLVPPQIREAATSVLTISKQNLSSLPSLESTGQKSPAANSIRGARDFSLSSRSPEISSRTHRDPGASSAVAASSSSRPSLHDASASGYADGNLTNTGSAANSATGDDGDDAVAPASATRGPGTNKSSQANNPSAAQPGAPQTKDPVPIVSLSDAPQGVPAQTAVVTPVSLQPPPDRSTNIPAAPQKSIDHPSADQAAAQPATTGPQAPPPAPIGPVQAARIVSRAAQSEMRIGLNTPSFG
ncbi:MAG: hypothetical protein ACRD9W_22825, partial [Terriglobia bacterium]